MSTVWLRGFRLSTQDHVRGKHLENIFDYIIQRGPANKNLSIFVLSPIINDFGKDVVMKLHFVIFGSVHY